MLVHKCKHFVATSYLVGKVIWHCAKKYDVKFHAGQSCKGLKDREVFYFFFQRTNLALTKLILDY
jgi:hypothetical protein